MLLSKISYNNINKNFYNKNDIDKPWHTFETEDIRKVLYSIREDGLVISTNKRTFEEKIVKPILSNSVLVVRINRKVYKVKNLVAKYFTDEYKDGMCVLLKDNNPYNCNVNNLIICDKKRSGELTGGKHNSKIKVVAKDKRTGEKTEYNSIREFCEKTYCGVRTYYDKKQGRYKTSILDDYKIKELVY